MADRFCDHIRIYELQGSIYDPYASDADIKKKLVYEGECKASLTQFYGSHSLPEDENYKITINEPDLTQINVRNIAFLETNSNPDDKVKLTIVEVKRYERNTVIHAIALKDGDITGDNADIQDWEYDMTYMSIRGASGYDTENERLYVDSGQGYILYCNLTRSIDEDGESDREIEIRMLESGGTSGLSTINTISNGKIVIISTDTDGWVKIGACDKSNDYILEEITIAIGIPIE